MSKTNASKEELMQYINMMQGLKDSGIKCEQEISQALRALNDMMFPDTTYDHVNVVVLVNNPTAVNYYYYAYKNLLKTERANGHFYSDCILYNENTKVRIVNVANMADENRLRGLEADILVNETHMDAEDLGIRTKMSKRG